MCYPNSQHLLITEIWFTQVHLLFLEFFCQWHTNKLLLIGSLRNLFLEQNPFLVCHQRHWFLFIVEIKWNYVIIVIILFPSFKYCHTLSFAPSRNHGLFSCTSCIFRQLYCWGIMGKFSLSVLEDTISQQLSCTSSVYNCIVHSSMMSFEP